MKSPINIWLRNKDRLTLVASQCRVFSTLEERFKGVMFDRTIVPTLFVMKKRGAVKLHSWFCCDGIDVVVLNENKQVVFQKPNWKPWGRLSYKPLLDPKLMAKFVLELPKGTIAGSGTRIGDEVQFYQTSKQKAEMKE